MAYEPQVGALAEVPAGRGIIRFSGTTAFAPGKWVGIELAEPKGKNGGSVQGVVYFQCKTPHGVFVRPSQVKVLSYPSGHPLAAGSSTAAPPSAMRPATNGHRRTSSIGLARAPSLRSNPPASPRSVSPAKPSGLSVQATPAPSRTRLVGSASPTKTMSFQSRRTSQHIKPDAVVPQPPAPEPRTPPEVVPRRRQSPIPEPPSTSKRSPSPLLQTIVDVSPTLQPPEIRTPVVKDVQVEQELQELRAKLRVLEAKRADEARNVEKLEAQLAEANSFVALRPKLQAKLSALQQDLIATRRALADSEQLAKLNEVRLSDSQEQLEMAMLDKEMAEERAEAVETELQTMQEQVASTKVELDSLKVGEVEDDAEDTVKRSLAYVQMEKHNQRLKEALIRLRDVSQETEMEQRHRIAEMEHELNGVSELHSEYESTLIKLSNAETQIDDLKLQLDDALGAEEMLVQLTERNLMLSEKIEEMRITIEDLEALRELNDELEENHVETEKAMQEDLDTKDAHLREQVRKNEELEDNCQDLENTILRFRDLVLQLQAELNSLRAQTETAQTESAAAVSQTAAMMSMNLKLQSSASKNQARNIELELRNIEAREYKELFGIVQLYLPQPYVESDSDATSCYLAFRRLASKADIINDVVAQVHGLPESLNGPVTDTLVGICDMRGRISALSHLCQRFAAVLRRCDVESFLSAGRIFLELAPMEKRIDIHLDLLRREEFREGECVSDINRIQAQLDHYAETYFNGLAHDLGERQLSHASSIDYDLEIFFASIGWTKTALQTIMKEQDVIVETGELDADAVLFDPLQQLLDQCKGARIVSRKLVKRLEYLVKDSGALAAPLVPQFENLNTGVSNLVNFGIQLAQSIMSHLSDVRNSKRTFEVATVLSFARQTAMSTVGQGKGETGASWSIISKSISLIIEESSALLPLAMEAKNVLKISGIPPWVTRVEEIKSAMAVNAEAERKVTQLNEEMQGLARGIRSRDQNLQEASVKIELMERRLETVKKQAETIADLENQMTKATKQERAYEEAMEQLQSDLDSLEQENVKLKAQSAVVEKQVMPGAQGADAETVVVEGSLETSQLLEQLDALRGAVRFLRQENSYLKSQDLLKELQSLPPLREPVVRPSTPPLDPSRSDDDGDDSDSSRPRTPPTLRSLAAETKLLYRDVITFSSAPRVVDLSELNKKSTGEGKGGKHWMRRKQTPAQQLLDRRMQAGRLSKRVRGLIAITNASGIPS